MNILAASIVIGGCAFWLWLGYKLFQAGFTKKRNRYRSRIKPVSDERSSIEQFKRICLDQRSRQ